MIRSLYGDLLTGLDLPGSGIFQLPDCPASSHSGIGMKKSNDAEPVQYQTKLVKSGIFLFHYQTEIMDAGILMPNQILYHLQSLTL
jgi:hypothetical protein